MELSTKLRSILIETQEKEITEYLIYKRLSEKAKGKNSSILKKSLMMNFFIITNGKNILKHKFNQIYSK